MTTLGFTLSNPLKPTWKLSNGKSYPTQRIPQILRRLIITCSGRFLPERWAKAVANDGQYFE